MLTTPNARTSRSIGSAWTALALAGAAAWTLTLLQARTMGAEPGTMGMSFPFFVAVWLAMMAAMMLPALGPSAAADGRVVGALAFGAGFLLPWAAYGAAAYGAFAATERLVDSSPDLARWLGVAILAVAGLYQLTPWKGHALSHCRMAHRTGPGAVARLSAGARDGLMCVGCCWALMATLVAMGSMNMAAMAGLAVVIFSEKVLPRPRLVAAAGGLALLAFAIVAAIEPSVLHGLTPVEGMHMKMPAPMTGM